jgi:glycerol-3-phosphate acyltransferase PlsY
LEEIGLLLIVCMLVGYGLGSVSSSYIAGKRIAGIDIREYGSGNAGATNTFRVLGPKVGVLVFAADVLKGVVACLFALWVSGNNPEAAGLAGAAAIVGHNWPVFFQFRGGKGVATTIGIMITLLFVPAATAGVLAILVLFWKRYVSLASMTLVTLTPVFVLVYRYPAEYFWLSVFIAVVTLWRHRQNIVRLLEGREKGISNNTGRKKLTTG